MGAADVTRFSSSLAVEGRIAASTRNQAMGAPLFLYRDVVVIDLPWLDGVVRAKPPERLPVVLPREGAAAAPTADGPDCAGTPRPSRRRDDPDLYPRPEPWTVVKSPIDTIVRA